MINKAILLGRVGKKDFKATRNDSFVCNLSIATNRKYIDSHGQSRENTTWHYVNCFGHLAEIANKYVEVGDLVYIEGEINHKKIMEENGSEKWIYSITGNQIKFIPTGRKNPTSSESKLHGDHMEDSQVMERLSDMDDSESIPF